MRVCVEDYRKNGKKDGTGWDLIALLPRMDSKDTQSPREVHDGEAFTEWMFTVILECFRFHRDHERRWQTEGVFGDSFPSPSMNIPTMSPVIVTIIPELSVSVSWSTNAPLPLRCDGNSGLSRGPIKVSPGVWCACVSVCSRSAAVWGVSEDRIQRGEPSVLAGLPRLQEDFQRDRNGGRRPTDLRWVRAGRCTQTGEAFMTSTPNPPS